jgi:hypothetical protein
MERPCPKQCSECDPESPHHWTEDCSILGGYGCRHCKAIAVECMACDLDGSEAAKDEQGRLIGEPCRACGGRKIVEVVRISRKAVDAMIAALNESLDWMYHHRPVQMVTEALRLVDACNCPPPPPGEEDE